MALAAEIDSPSLILDDLKARKLAMQLNLEFTGTIGVLVAAKIKRVIPSLGAYFERIRLTDFRIPPDLLEDLLNKYEN